MSNDVLVPVACAQERSTASISYVIPTESQQQDVAHLYERLPHVFIRPPNLQPFTPSTVSAVMELLKSSSVAVALLPAKQDGLIKKYLLQPKQRHQLLQQAGCRSCEIQGGVMYITPGHCNVCVLNRTLLTHLTVLF